MGLFDLFIKKSGTLQRPVTINGEGKLPKRIEDFDWCHYKVLRRLKNHPVNEPFSGYMAGEVDIPRFIPILMSLGLIEIGTYEDGLKALNVDTLKRILKSAGLKVSGNKTTLIERIKENLTEEEVRALNEYSDIYVYTEVTKPVIDASYDKFDEERTEFFQKAVGFIVSGDMDSAYRMICKRNAEMPIPPGIGCDWEEWYYRGIKKDEEEIYSRRLQNSKNKMITAMAIYQAMGGLHKKKEICDYGHSEEAHVRIRNERNYIVSDRHRKEYKRDGITKYRYIACLDDMTCPICGELDGKVFNTDESVIGVNYPPMHKGCRCTTIAAFDGMELSGKRSARDPITHKSILVPASMTYKEWKAEYLDKEIK